MSETLKAISLFLAQAEWMSAFCKQDLILRLVLKSTRIVVLPFRENIKRKKIPLYMRVIYESLAPVQSLKRLNCRRVKSIYCLAAPLPSVLSNRKTKIFGG